MFKRFLRHNKMLATVLVVAACAVLVLFVILIIQYIAMSRANSKVVEMRATIADLLNPRKHRVAAVDGNLTLIAQDKEFYTAKLAELKSYFGNPYYPAIDAMSKKLQKTVVETEKVVDENGDEKIITKGSHKVPYINGLDLIDDFKKFVAEDNEHVSYRLARFSRNHGDAWNAAMQEFIRLANEASFEDIDADNCNEFFLFAAGFPRDRYQKEGATAVFLKEQKIKMSQYLLKKEIVVGQDASDFSLNIGSVADSQAIAEVMFHLDIVGYLVSLIGSAEVGVKSLQSLAFEEEAAVPNINNFMRCRYKLIVTGSLASLRELSKKLNDSYKDKRIFKIKNVKLYVDPEFDDGARIMSLAGQKFDESAQVNNEEEENTRDNIFSRSKSKKAKQKQEQKTEEQKLDLFDESSLPYHERSTYGELVLGGSDDVTMEMELDYYFLKK